MKRAWHSFILGSFLSLCGMGLQAQPVAADSSAGVQADSVILFRFVPGRLMFYSPYQGNDEAIRNAAELIDRNRRLITDGKAWVVVRGFCGSYASRAQNLRAAKNRSNQVKSWFITHHGMKEDYYRTVNSDSAFRGSHDVVALLGLMYAPGYEPKPAGPTPEQLQARRDSLEQLRVDSLRAIEAAPSGAAAPRQPEACRSLAAIAGSRHRSACRTPHTHLSGHALVHQVQSPVRRPAHALARSGIPLQRALVGRHRGQHGLVAQQRQA